MPPVSNDTVGIDLGGGSCCGGMRCTLLLEDACFAFVQDDAMSPLDVKSVWSVYDLHTHEFTPELVMRKMMFKMQTRQCSSGQEVLGEILIALLNVFVICGIDL
eukprot:1654777-Amphidinium_carterae.1